MKNTKINSYPNIIRDPENHLIETLNDQFQYVPKNDLNDKTDYSKGHYWRNFTLNLPHLFLTQSLIIYITNNFYDSILNPILDKNNNLVYCIIFKVVFQDSVIRSISPSIVFTRRDKKQSLVDNFIDSWFLKGDVYHMKEISKIVISYRSYNSLDRIKLDRFHSRLVNKNMINNQNTENNEFEYFGNTLPNTTDLSKWGLILNNKEDVTINILPRSRNRNKTVKYTVFQKSDCNYVQVFSNDKLLLTFVDYFKDQNKDKSTFKRVIQNRTTIIYQKGVQVKTMVLRKVPSLKPRAPDFELSHNFITLDLETKNLNGKLIPICISLYDGKDCFSFYITDYSSEFEMFKSAFGFLNKRKYHYQKVYIHNLSSFDGVFLLKFCTKIGEAKPLMRNGLLYEIKLKLFIDSTNKTCNKNNRYTIIIRDSYLILPVSLRKLSNNFKVGNPKSIFPIFAVNDLPLEYRGQIPSKRYFLSNKDYIDYINDNKEIYYNWDLKKELIKYCENDVIALHQVLDHFAKFILNHFFINIHKTMTLSSLAIAIFLVKYLNDSKIPKIQGQMYEDIVQSYRGGLVDMYLPQGSNLFAYDINSEYPEAMCKELPAGKVEYIKGNINLKDSNLFGFFKANIIAPDNLNIPILPVKYKGINICPLGRWTDWYFSEELREAEKFGYKIELIHGYNFQRKILFKDFVNDLYSMKEQSSKDQPDYTISKLLLNMLYGRFGMKPGNEICKIISAEESQEYFLNPDILIVEHFVFDTGKEYIKYIKNKNIEQNDLELFVPNISIAIASAVVAYGRIKINELKHRKGFKVYYSDTDSIFIDKPLPEELIGTKLGQLKLENKIKSGYFIAPKVYGYITENLNNIVKVKGLKDKLLFFELNNILYRNIDIKKYQEKWYRFWNKGEIYILNEIYTLKVTDNKRQLIYNSYNKLVDTKPYIYINGEIINKEIGFILNIKAPDFKNKLVK